MHARRNKIPFDGVKKRLGKAKREDLPKKSENEMTPNHTEKIRGFSGGKAAFIRFNA